jgi:SAM-dependent methyltransferase
MKTRIQREMNCDYIAPIYAFGERLCFGGALQKRREEFLREARDARHAIVLGDGDGRFTAALLQSNEAVRVTYVDKSGSMIEEARKRVSRLGREALPRVSFHCSDALDFFLEETRFDLIATHFFLDCLREQDVQRLAQQISFLAAPNALWLVSEFRQAPLGWGRVWTGAVIRGLYCLFRLTTGLPVTGLPDYAKFLKANGFVAAESRVALRGLLISELWEKVRDHTVETIAVPAFPKSRNELATRIIRAVNC